MFLLYNLNFALALISLLLAVATVGLYLDYFLWKGRYFSTHINKFAWLLVIGATVSSVALSLLYSEYFGFIPCSLCWLQRIAIYPQALLALMAFRLQDDKHFPLYGIGLSAFGFVVAIYQYLYQMLPKEILESGVTPCLADVVDANCADKIIDQFGFVTFPFISAVTFAFLIIVYLYMRRTSRN